MKSHKRLQQFTRYQLIKDTPRLLILPVCKILYYLFAKPSNESSQRRHKWIYLQIFQ